MKTNTQKTKAPQARHLAALGLSCLAAWPVVSAAQVPAGSAYFTDPQESYVQDATSEAIGSVNNIMCYLSSMSPGALVNEPLYAALVDSKRCETGAQDAAATPSYVRALVSSTRLSNADPMNYRVWVEQRDGDREQDIFVRGSTTEGPSAGRPNGLFRIDYATPGVPGGAPVMQGYLAAEAGGMSFVEQSDRGQGPSSSACGCGPDRTMRETAS
ncbi:MAG: hypothetical protein R3E68_16290 [Burkholderiaceae bacterium]